MSPIDEPPATELDHICVAVDLLRQMMSELQSLEICNAKLTRVMAIPGYGLRRRFDMLERTTELLIRSPNANMMRERSMQAKILIRRLASDLDQLISRVNVFHRD